MHAYMHTYIHTFKLRWSTRELACVFSWGAPLDVGTDMDTMDPRHPMYDYTTTTSTTATTTNANTSLSYPQGVGVEVDVEDRQRGPLPPPLFQCRRAQLTAPDPPVTPSSITTTTTTTTAAAAASGAEAGGAGGEGGKAAGRMREVLIRYTQNAVAFEEEVRAYSILSMRQPCRWVLSPHSYALDSGIGVLSISSKTAGANSLTSGGSGSGSGGMEDGGGTYFLVFDAPKLSLARWIADNKVSTCS